MQQKDQPYFGSFENEQMDCDIKKNLKKLKEDLGNSNDLVTREIVSGTPNLTVAFVYIDGLTDTTSVSEFTIQTVMDEIGKIPSKEELHGEYILNVLKEKSFTIGELNVLTDWKMVYQHLISGDTIVFIDGCAEGIAAGTKGGERRSVSEPTAQTVIRGPREGFTESIRTNTALLRRKIKSPYLWLEETQIGRVTQTDVGIMYIHGIVEEEIVQEVRERLGSIDIDGILESGYIEELIETTHVTLFPTIYNSERPDVIAANLLEGRVAILVDGTPFVLLVPTTFNMFFQSAEDYYQRFDVGSLIRVLRYISFVIGLLLPSFYVAIINFHQEMIPTSWLLKLAVQREGVPFPAVVETFIMELIFEVLREAGVRMPRTVGSTISIVGGLVLGEAAVEAGIVSAAAVIVVSLTAIASFVSPTYNMGIAARMLRFILLIFASILGMYGISIFLLLLVLHLCSLKSIKVPYMAPYAPLVTSDMKDSFFRFPFSKMKKRPKLINQKNPVRFRSDGQPENYSAKQTKEKP